MKTPFLFNQAFTLALSLTLLLSACSKAAPEQEKATENAPFKTQALSEIAVAVQYSAPATASSLNESTLKAEISARIDNIPARVGDVVKKGDVLVKLNCADARAQQQQAEANTEAAKARAQLAAQQLKRALALKQKRSVSEELLGQRQSEAAAAQAEVKARGAAQSIAHNQRQRCTIKAPYNAIVVERSGQVGELASPGTPMLKIVSTDDLEISAEIIPSDATSLEQTQNVQFLTPQPYSVKLRALTAAVGSLTRTREARLFFTGQAPLPGTPGRLSWSDARLGLPSEFLSERQGRLGVFIVQDNTAKFITLKHAQEGRVVAVDFPADTHIITTGRTNVKDGDPLNNTEDLPAASVNTKAAK